MSALFGPTLNGFRLGLKQEGQFPTASVAALAAANLFPLAGVLFFGWTVGEVMLLFWLENVIVGGFNVLRMLMAAKGGIAEQIGKLFVIPFFLVHYGMFTFVHGLFVISIFVQGDMPESPESMPAAVLAVVAGAGLGWAIAALVGSHGVSFFTNYLGRGEYRERTAGDLMAKPYARVVILHVVIIFGGMLVMVTGQPVAALLLLVVLKVVVDLAAHLGEHIRVQRDDELAALKARARR